MAAAVDLARIPLRDLEAVFFDAGNTLVGIDVALVAEGLAARGLAATAAEVARAEAAARPAVYRRLEGGI